MSGATARRAYADLPDGSQLHYRWAGHIDSPALLLLHQTPSHSAMFDSLISLLSSDFYVLAPDTPGFGNSDPLSCDVTIGSLAKRIAELPEGLGLSSYFVFGHHTGAAIAKQLCHDYPERVSALVLSGPTYLDAEQKQALRNSVSASKISRDGDHLLPLWQRLRDKDPGANVELTQREFLSALGCGDAYQSSYYAVSEMDCDRVLESIECPVLVFAGDRDALYASVKPTLKKLKFGKELVLPPGSGTYVCDQESEFLAEKLTSYFCNCLKEIK